MPRALLVLLACAPTAAAAGPDFGRDVRPILADKCFHCHGPDAQTRAAGLRLDTPAGATAARKRGGPAVVPGRSAESEAVRRVLSDDPAEVMPPPDANRPLTDAQKRTLKAWVDAGAEYRPHWAFVPPPAAVPVPAVKPGWARTPVDHFVLDRLTRAGLAPGPEAPPEAWLRRVSLDLTGLPPTPAEVDAFLHSARRDPQSAFPEAVDRLLASPRYGERMASDWLDLARFADTHGYQADRDRPVWPYRDWVVAAFNRNLTYDRFLTEQLAGDLLPSATKQQRLATAFNRLHMQNEEGGVVEEEFRVAYVADRVATAGTAFLGLTLDCCRCHDHKYDPLSQKDYYGLFALFQNVDEAGQTPYFVHPAPVPALALSTDAQDAQLAELRRTVAGKERALAAARAGPRALHRLWQRAVPPGPLGAVPGVTRFAFDGEPGGPKATPIESPAAAPGRVGRGVRLSGDDGFTFPGVPAVSRADPFTVGVWLRPAALAARAVVLHQSKAPIDAGSRGFDLLLEDGRPAFGLYHMWPGDAVKVRAVAPVPVNRWSHVAATSDGSGRAAGLALYVDGRAVPVEVVRDRLAKDITYPGKQPPLTLGQRFRDSGFRGDADEVTVAGRALAPPEVAALAGVSLPPDSPGWADWFADTQAPAVLAARGELTAARRALAAFREPIPEIMVMDELPAPKPAFVLKRGQYDAPGEPVTAGTPAALPPFPAAAPRDRLGLARWLAHPDHPLTARVQVNRLWQQLFGAGLVDTPDNFGLTGTPPTHPELLDWLARDYVSRGWDTKALLRQLALSSTYRLSSSSALPATAGRPPSAPALPATAGRAEGSSRPHADARRVDPLNRLLARMPARRLTAEMLRDQALAASGLLTEKVGGPSVYPYQPAGLWDEAMGRPTYPQSAGADLVRRTLYTVAKRTAPHPQLSTFDAPDRSVCVARRQQTATPLQALALLNDPQLVEAARHLGARAPAAAGAPPERVAWLFRAATGRAATPAERDVLARLFAEARGRYEKDPAAAAKLLSVGASPPTPGGADAAAAATVALAVLNHADAVRR